MSGSLTGFPPAVNCIQRGQARSGTARDCIAVVGECCFSFATQPIRVRPSVMDSNCAVTQSELAQMCLKRHSLTTDQIYIFSLQRTHYVPAMVVLCYGSVHKVCTISSRKRNSSNPQIDPRLQALIVRFDVMLE